MKKATKFFAVLLASLMLVSVANVTTPVMAAANTYTVQLTGTTDATTTNHEYKVYQLYTGELSTDSAGKKVLANVVYGTAWGTDAKKAGATVADTELAELDKKSASDAEAFADKYISAMKTVYGTLKESNGWKLENVPTGYYLIVDDTEKSIADGDTYSKYIVQVVQDVNIAPKSESESSDKKVYNDSLTEAQLNEAGVGTVSSYKLTGTIAQNAGSYNYYNFVMADKLSSGLTFNNDVTVTMTEGTTTTTLTKDTDYKLYTGADVYKDTTDASYTFQVALLNAKAHPGATITVMYSATLNSNAVAMVPETNDYKVIYSRDPETTYGGDTDNPKPGLPKETYSNVFGTTPGSTTKTYTTKLTLTKVDDSSDKNPLAGATFKLVSSDANQTVVTQKEYFVVNNDVADANAYYLLKDGTYTKDAPTDTTWTKIGTGDSNTTEGYIKDGDNYVVPTDTKDYIDQDLYMKVLGTSSQYASLNKYEKKQNTTTATASETAPVEVILTTGDDGVLNFTGLASGTYTLTEVDAPDGFNYVKPITFTIGFDEDANDDGNTDDATFTISNVTNATIANNSGTFATEVTDKKGSVLPSTGGIGTTIFYIVGGCLVLGAGVVLVARKRVEK